VRDLRSGIRDLLQDKFGELPESVLQKIAACTDLAQLRTALRQAPKQDRLEDLKL
jgi:hypothetical protein